MYKVFTFNSNNKSNKQHVLTIKHACKPKRNSLIQSPPQLSLCFISGYAAALQVARLSNEVCFDLIMN
jgi:hypothetical protein